MKIKRYIGKDTQEALVKVKMDLGNDAIILNTKKIRQKGIKKYFSSPMIEIMAAVDGDSSKPKEKDFVNTQIPPNFPVKEKNILSQKEEKITQLENKVNNIENSLNKIYDIIKNQKKDTEVVNEVNSQVSQVYQLLYNNLIKNEVDQELAESIIEQVKEKSDARNVNDASMVMKSVLTSMLGNPEPISFREDGKPTIVLFVGPTGVGKTTTLAKLAATFMLTDNKKVGFITADTYRIAAVEQLKTYAEILGIPISIAYSVGEINKEIQKYDDKDLIFIDTAGCSHMDKNKFGELNELVQICHADDVFLVLSTTVSSRNCKEIIKNYNFIPDFKLIFTKLDETPVYGSILNAKCFSKKSLSYFTNGQNVPDDIEIANVDVLSKNLLGSRT